MNPNTGYEFVQQWFLPQQMITTQQAMLGSLVDENNSVMSPEKFDVNVQFSAKQTPLKQALFQQLPPAVDNSDDYVQIEPHRHHTFGAFE